MIAILLLAIFIVVLCMKIKCPDCGGEMEDWDIHKGLTVYKCKKCGKEWI